MVGEHQRGCELDLKGKELFLLQTRKRTSLREIAENKIKGATVAVERVGEEWQGAFRKIPKQSKNST